MMPDDYQIPDDPDNGRMDAAYLRTCLGLRLKPGEPPPEFPDAIRRAYYGMSRRLSLLGAKGASMTPTQLAIVVELAALRDSGVELPPEEPLQASFMDEVNEGRVVSGQKVAVHWRGKDRPAHFIEKEGDRLKVLVDGDDIRFRPVNVRYPEEGEFPDVPDNINKTVEA